MENILKETRIKKGYSLRQFSKISGLSINVIVRYETNLDELKNAKFDTLLRFSLALDLEVEKVKKYLYQEK